MREKCHSTLNYDDFIKFFKDFSEKHEISLQIHQKRLNNYSIWSERNTPSFRYDLHGLQQISRINFSELLSAKRYFWKRKLVLTNHSKLPKKFRNAT